MKMRVLAPVLAALFIAAPAFADDDAPPPVKGETPVVTVDPGPSGEPPPPPPPQDRPRRERDVRVDLHLDTAWSIRRFDTLTIKAPDFGAGVGFRGSSAAAFLTLRFVPGSSTEDITVRTYGFDFDVHLIWGHFRLIVGVAADIVALNRITRDNTILGSFVTFDMGPRVDLVQLEPVTVFLHAIGRIGGDDNSLYLGAQLGGGIEFDVAKQRSKPRADQ